MNSMVIGEEFKKLLDEFMKQTRYKSWQFFLRSKDIEITEEYRLLGPKINKAKEAREDKLLANVVNDSLVSEKIEADRIAVARDEVIEHTMRIISEVEDVADKYKQIQILEKANQLLSAKRSGVSDGVLKIKYKDLVNEVESEPDDEESTNNIVKIGE